MNKPVITYFSLVFLIAWGAVIIVVGPQGLKGEATPDNAQLLPTFAAMLLGPAVVGLSLTYLSKGKKGLRELWKRQTRWRVGLRWYAIALLATPILILVILFPLSRVSDVFLPSIIASDNVAQVVAFGLIFGIFAGLLEEIGWTGFALPRLRKRYSLIMAGLILGLIWGAWHGLADYWGAHAKFAMLWLPRIVLWTLALTAYRMLMAWVYDNTESLFVAQLMHASFTGSQGLLVPTLSRIDHFLWYGPFTVVLWLIIFFLAPHIKKQDTKENKIPDTV